MILLLCMKEKVVDAWLSQTVGTSVEAVKAAATHILQDSVLIVAVSTCDSRTEFAANPRVVQASSNTNNRNDDVPCRQVPSGN